MSHVLNKCSNYDINYLFINYNCNFRVRLLVNCATQEEVAAKVVDLAKFQKAEGSIKKEVSH